MPATWAALKDLLWTDVAASWASVVTGAVAVYFALQSWRASVVAVRSSYRPLLRPVPSTRGNRDQGMLIIKNYGTGPALSVVVMEAPQGPWLGTADIIEPLGPRDGANEAMRVGRHVLNLIVPLAINVPHRMLYQDLGGRWHETTFRLQRVPMSSAADEDVIVMTENIVEVEYLGPRRCGFWFRQIPSSVAKHAGDVKSRDVS